MVLIGATCLYSITIHAQMTNMSGLVGLGDCERRVVKWRSGSKKRNLLFVHLSQAVSEALGFRASLPSCENCQFH